jgi:hypothetical protein
VSKIEYHFVKLGISLEDLQDLILTRFDFTKNISQPASQPASSEGAGRANTKLGVKLL